uniref:Cyclin-dependent kinase inhibitor 1C (p57, Kip2) n=1 Tax=Nothobranchius korthausae TaxID=1143690 RepID=A0A1A8FXP8_9TELE
MSHVQLSSSALERLVARRTFPLHRRTGVCRNLFGPVDHDELSRDTKAKLREFAERDQQRWNFNFETNTPLAGDYEWEEVSAEKTPAFYLGSAPQSGRDLEPPTPVKQRPSLDSGVPETDTHGDVMERLAAPGSSTAPGPAETNQENRADKLNSGSPRQVPCVRRKRTSAADSNTHITDFFVKRKRTADVMVSGDARHLSKSPIPLEQTPRKRIR